MSHNKKVMKRDNLFLFFTPCPFQNRGPPVLVYFCIFFGHRADVDGIKKLANHHLAYQTILVFCRPFGHFLSKELWSELYVYNITNASFEFFQKQWSPISTANVLISDVIKGYYATGPIQYHSLHYRKASIIVFIQH